MPLLWTLAIACFAGAISIRLVDPIIPEMARALATDPAVIALLASAFAFPYALAQPILGPAGDTFGKSRVIKIGLGVLTASLIATALAPTLELIFVARVVAGIAGGAIIPVALAMVGDRVALADRQVALSNILSAMLVAQLVSLVGSGMIASFAGWRWTFATGALIALLAFVAALTQLKPRPGPRGTFNVANLRESYADVFANPKAKYCYGAVFLEGLAIFGLLPFVAIMLEARGAGGIVEAGMVIAGMGLGGLLFTLTITRVLRRVGGMFNVIRMGGVAVAIGFLGVAAAGSWPFEMAAFAVLGFGFYSVHNALQTQATELAPAHRGAAVALHAFFFFVGHAAGPPTYALAFAWLGQSVTIAGFGCALGLGAWWLASALQEHTAP